MVRNTIYLWVNTGWRARVRLLLILVGKENSSMVLYACKRDFLSMSFLPKRGLPLRAEMLLIFLRMFLEDTLHPVRWTSILLLLFSPSVVSDSLWPHGLQHARLPCPSPSPGVCLNSCPLSQRSIYTALISFMHFSQVCAGAWQHKQKQSQEVPGVQGVYWGRRRAAKWIQRASKVWGSNGKRTNTFFS